MPLLCCRSCIQAVVLLLSFLLTTLILPVYAASASVSHDGLTGSPADGSYLHDKFADFSFECPAGQALVGFYSKFYNLPDADRRWKLHCAPGFPSSTPAASGWSAYSEYEKDFKLQSASYYDVICGLQSDRKNGKWDRKYRVKFCRIDTSLTPFGRETSGWQNDYDGTSYLF